MIDLRKFNQDKLPPCGMYGDLVSEVSRLLKITPNEARKRYGCLTIGQWKELINEIKQ